MKKRIQRINRVKAIVREWSAGTYAGQLLDEMLRQNSGLLAEEEFEPVDVRHWRENLPGTYIIRIFAEFEAALRDVWANHFQRDTVPPMRDLIETIGMRRGMPSEVVEDVHKVRSYRNNLVHEGSEEVDFLPLEHAQSFLNTFLSWLPLDW